MRRHSGQPFNEDHPDYERLVLQAQPQDDDDKRALVMQLVMPADILLAMLHDEMWQLRRQWYGVVGAACSTLLWALMPFVAIVFDMPGPAASLVLASVVMAVVHGMVCSLVWFAYHLREKRWEFLGDLHRQLHEIVGQADGPAK